MKKENETTNNSKPMAYDTLLGVVNWLKNEQGYKEYKDQFEHPYTNKTLTQTTISPYTIN